MAELQKINLGTAPAGRDGDPARTANQKMNDNVDVLSAQAALTTAPMITASRTLTSDHIGRRVSISIAADGGVVKLIAAAKCEPDSMVWLVNVGAKSVAIAADDGSGDAVALKSLGPGEAAALDTDGVDAWRTLIRGRAAGDSESVRGDLAIDGGLKVAGGAAVGGPLEIPNAVKVNQAVTLGQIVERVGQSGGLCFRNKLMNARFAVNQRGYVSGTNVGSTYTYTVDRWRVMAAGQALVLTPAENGYTVTAPIGGVEQYVEGANIEGGTYVLSWTGTAMARVGGVPVTNGKSFSCTGGANLSVQFFGGTVSTPQLEQGDTPTRFESRPISIELAMCQRYYESGGRIYGAPYTRPSGVNTGDANCFATVQFKVTKRVPPAMGGWGSYASLMSWRDVSPSSAIAFLTANSSEGEASIGSWWANAEL